MINIGTYAEASSACSLHGNLKSGPLKSGAQTSLPFLLVLPLLLQAVWVCVCVSVQ